MKCRAGTAATYLYDPLGRRQAKVVNGVTTSFLSDGAEEVAEYTGAGALLRRYIPGPGTDQPIAMVTPAGLATWRSGVPDPTLASKSCAVGLVVDPG